MSEVGDRVGAICSYHKEDGLSLYGEGTYIGDLYPSAGPFEGMGIRNPCIRLDDGDYVWGYQCWWGELEEVKRKYGEKAWNDADIVTTPSIPPLEEGHDEMA